MRKLTMLIVGAIALLFVGMFAWNSDAASLTGATALPAINYSMVEKAGCGPRQGFFANCASGEHWQAGECVPCPRAFVCPLPPNCCTGTIRGTPYNCRAVRPNCTRGFCPG